jgi:hypothetical protein
MPVRRLIALVLLVLFSPSLSAQTPSDEPAAAAALPVRRVVLYKTGVGYFEHLGNVRDRQDVTIRFTSAQLNDVLKSLTTIDLGKGRITGVSYNSVAPVDQRLGALRLPIDGTATIVDLLSALRGARVEVGSGPLVAGRLLSVERRPRVEGNRTTTVETLSIMSDAGEVRTFELTPALRVRIAERDLRQEVSRYLDVVGSAREQDVRRMTISSSGSGERPLLVSYISEVPIWKSTYRLVLSPKGNSLLQGWAIVDNTIGEDWSNVELSLVAGAPQSFIQQISQPYYGRRPVVPLPLTAVLTPQTHQATLSEEVRVQADAKVATAGPTSDSAQRRAAGGGMGGGTGGGAFGGTVGGVVAGSPEPPPPAAMPQRAEINARLASQQAAAEGSNLGDLFEYHIKEPITVRKNQSALVPVVNAEIAAEKVVLWNRPSGSGRPLRAVWITNTSELTLDGGSMTLIEGNAFAGEGLVEALKPGERRLVSYAADLGVLVSAKQNLLPGRVSRIRAHDGIVIHDVEERAATTYTARNENDFPVTLVVEHRVRSGYKLTEGQAPAESTPDAYRFRMTIAPKKSAELTVREAGATESTIAITELADTFISGGIRAFTLNGDLERALKPVFDKRTEVASLERSLSALKSQHQSIVQDQERLRENMKALRGSSEEKQLLQRYTRQLDEQENRLDDLRRQIGQAEASLEKARAELSKLIEGLSFDVKGS